MSVDSRKVAWYRGDPDGRRRARRGAARVRAEELRGPGGAEIGLDTPLLAERIVDSMGVTLLAAFIEEEYGVPFDGTELRQGRLETVRALARLLDRL